MPTDQGKPKDMRSGRFEKGLTEAMRELNASIGFDRRLYREDIAGSLAWAKALEARGLLSSEEEKTPCALPVDVPRKPFAPRLRQGPLLFRPTSKTFT